jgi:hypothetical protein
MGATGRSKSTQVLADSVTGISARTSQLPVAIIFFGLLFLSLVIAIVYGWRQWGRTVVARPVYRIAAENIRTTPPPAWIRSDVRGEIIRDGALQDLTVFDKDVTIRVYQAFELHPWVLKVNRVSKHPPARLDVDLDYRVPVAWVEVPRGVLPGNDGGVIPVDGNAVVLPSRDFSQEHLPDYLRISINGISPCGLAGTPWGDTRVTGAARIAALLQDVWRDAKLFRVRLSTAPDVVRHDSQPIFELETREHRRLIWGHAPGEEVSDEPSSTVKVHRLNQLVETVGELDKSTESVWDLRTAESFQSKRIAREFVK